jgi:ATP-dependent helicase HrpB
MPTPLPIDPVIPDVADALVRRGRCVLEAPPGAGKTTRVPPGLLADGRLGAGRIVMLEPRRLAARAAAARIAAERGEPVGRTVGYRVRLDSKVGPDTRIEVVTEGVLTRMIQADPSLAGVDVLIFDEFHERSLNADLGLALALDTAALREDLAILVMSATLDGQAVASLLGDSPIVRSQGRAHPVETRWQPGPTGDLVDDAALAAAEAVGQEAGSALVFLPGRREIERARSLLERQSLPDDVRVLPLYGDLPRQAQDQAIAPSPPGTRKIVLATAIAETSLTIEDVRIVVDAGLARRARFDPGTGMTRLITEPAARAEIDQRRGRAGRTGPGIAIRLWPKAAEGSRPASAPPEILEADLAPLALDLALWGAPADQLAWLDPPPPKVLAEAAALLRALDAIDDTGRPTDHGRALARLPLHPRLAHMVARAPDELTATAIALALVLEGQAGRPHGRDLAAALAERAGPRASGALSQAQAALAKRLGLGNAKPIRPDRAGALAALAYPDRVARRRPGQPGRYLMVSGRGARLDPDDPLAAADWLAIAHTDGRSPEARIRLAAALGQDDVADLIEAAGGRGALSEDRVYWDRAKGEVIARQEVRLGAITVAATTLADPPGEAVAKALCAAVRDRGLVLLDWDQGAARWLARARFTAAYAGQDWPALDEASLLTELEEWLAPFLTGARKIADLREVDLLAALQARLGWERCQTVDRLAPDRLAIPSGRAARIDYTADGPVLAAKLQELFGLTESPSVAGGAVPVTVHMLSPAGQPLAMTRDLPFFWRETYPQVRREMRGRYPKHPWPEDPMVAPATARTKAAVRRARRSTT